VGLQIFVVEDTPKHGALRYTAFGARLPGILAFFWQDSNELAELDAFEISYRRKYLIDT
jgi:hypothetical protein